jgi:hypothetical protein
MPVRRTDQEAADSIVHLHHIRMPILRTHVEAADSIVPGHNCEIAPAHLQERFHHNLPLLVFNGEEQDGYGCSRYDGSSLRACRSTDGSPC